MVKNKQEGLTAKQNMTLQTVESFQDRYKYFPSTREIAEQMGIKSSNTIFSHLQALQNKGYLQKNTKGQIIALRNGKPFRFLHDFKKAVQIPFFPDTVPAGFQAPAEDAKKELITIDQYVIRHPYNTFALKVRGNSMEKAGIMPEDLILVEKRTDAKPGQIVVAHLPGGFTVKRLVEKNGQRVLQAESTEQYEIKMEEGTTIWGVVVGTIRKYT